jgi:hypothetical protein
VKLVSCHYHSYVTQNSLEVTSEVERDSDSEDVSSRHDWHFGTKEVCKYPGYILEFNIGKKGYFLHRETD